MSAPSSRRFSQAYSDSFNNDSRYSLASYPQSPSASPSVRAGLLPRSSYFASTPDGSDHSHAFPAPSISSRAPIGGAYEIGKADWADEDDDDLHDPGKSFSVGAGPSRYVKEHQGWLQKSWWSWRGIANMAPVVLLLGGLIGVFGAYPAIDFIYNTNYVNTTGFITSTNGSVGGAINSNMPLIFNRTGLIDPDTPAAAKTVTNVDGVEMHLVFSDEFNQDGRYFGLDEDPFFQAMDFHYWSTGDLEWYDPANVRTVDGHLELSLTKETAANSHGLGYLGGMLQSWSRFCFTGGRIEVALSLPGDKKVSGFWPAAWTLGNLGRPGYGATLEGTWPYSYEACDVGTLQNQSLNGVPAFKDGFSYLAGQKLSACTCPGELGVDHPGPQLSNGSFKGRSASEIDIIEATNTEASQSAQFAPFDSAYTANTQFMAFNLTTTEFNTHLDAKCYNSTTEYCMFAYELNPTALAPSGGHGNITWYNEGEAVWRMTDQAVAANASIGISQRPITSEPQSIIFNLGMSTGFTTVNEDELEFPAFFRIDYVRVYQPKGSKMTTSCSPDDYPTYDYIQNHIEAYSNPNLTTWKEYGGVFPDNRLTTTCS